jgi:hypothetical protein
MIHGHACLWSVFMFAEAGFVASGAFICDVRQLNLMAWLCWGEQEVCYCDSCCRARSQKIYGGARIEVQ